MGVTLFTNYLFSLLFPERRDAQVVRSLNPALMQTLILHHTLPHGVALLPYADSRVRALIHEAKFFRNETAHTLLGIVLHNELVTYTEAYTLLPIPLSRERERERGYNQITQIVQRALVDTHHRVDTSLLLKSRHTPPQTSLTKRVREHNLRDAFQVTTSVLPPRILLIDDVSTTGSTLRECRTTLLRAGACEVRTIALAH